MKDYLLPIDYINKNKDVPLTANNFNDGDLLLFAALPLIDISNVELPKENEKKSITLKELIDNQIKLHNNEKYGLVLSRNLNRFLEACKDAKRYENLKFYNQYFKLNNKTQSSYFMCDISKNITVVDFSGTDDSVTGWVENLKLLVEQEQECLVNAKDYVNRNCKDENKYYIFVGHSKGGLICNYALLTANQEVKDRVIVAYDMDGPGFSKEFIKKHKDDPCLEQLIFIAPRGSIVGRLFNQFKKAVVIKSSGRGIYEHNPATWVLGDDFNFIRCKTFSKRSSVTEMMVKKYMNQLGKKESEDLVNAMSKILNAGNAKTLTRLVAHPLKLIRATFSLPRAEKKQVLTVPFKLIKLRAKSRIEINKAERKNEKPNN